MSEMKEFIKRIGIFPEKHVKPIYYQTDEFIFFSEEERERMKAQQKNFFLNHDSLGSPKMTIKEWNVIRSAMGKPRRFSANFIKGELEKLRIFRDTVRESIKNPGQAVKLPLDFDPVYASKIKKTSGLKVSQAVFAVHPLCGHLHFGKVLTVDENMTVVNFLGNDLGVQRIPDTHIAVCPASDNRPNGSFTPGLGGETGSRANFDFQLIALMLELCSRKSYLIHDLRKFNNLGEVFSSSLNERFFYDMKWTMQQIEEINRIIEMVFRSGSREGESGGDDESEERIDEGFFKVEWDKITNSNFYFFLRRKLEQSPSLEKRQEISTVLNEVYKRLEVSNANFFLFFSPLCLNERQNKNLSDSKDFLSGITSSQPHFKAEEAMEEEQPTLDQTLPLNELLAPHSNTKMETEPFTSSILPILEESPIRIGRESRPGSQPDSQIKEYKGFKIIEEESHGNDELIQTCICSLLSLNRNPPASNKFQENGSMQKLLAASFRVSEQCFHNLVGVTLVLNQKLKSSS